MKNIMMILSYDGTDFHGSQRQPNLRTVQGEIEKALKKILNEDINMVFAGRTDKGVHAKYQVANFKTKSNFPGESFKFKLVKYLPKDINIIESKEMDDNFHSRFDAKSKTYQYFIYNDKEFYPYMRNYKLHIKHKLNIEKMRKAALLLQGTHDFSAFMKLDDDYKNPIRNIDEILIEKNASEIVLTFKAESFLYNQVRNMVGILIDIGRGFREVSYINEIFEKKVLRAAKTYGPQGLYLTEILY